MRGVPAHQPGRWFLLPGGSLHSDGFVISLRWRVLSDFHCVTSRRRLGNLREGVATRELVNSLEQSSLEPGIFPVHCYDKGWTTNLPIDMIPAPDFLIATHHDGGLIVPPRYSWKSAKWVGAIEFTEDDKPGFWERNGYHTNGDPWREEGFAGH